LICSFSCFLIAAMLRRSVTSNPETWSTVHDEKRFIGPLLQSGLLCF